jgi:hypothetical protein
MDGGLISCTSPSRQMPLIHLLLLSLWFRIWRWFEMHGWVHLFNRSWLLSLLSSGCYLGLVMLMHHADGNPPSLTCHDGNTPIRHPCHLNCVVIRNPCPGRPCAIAVSSARWWSFMRVVTMLIHHPCRHDGDPSPITIEQTNGFVSFCLDGWCYLSEYWANHLQYCA